MNNIQCSILIPTYNGEQFLEKTLQSCLAQSIINNIEIIVVDDCSQDSSAEIVQTLASSHSAIIFIKNEHNLGINKSINKAASFAQGKYLIFLGHDDLLRPEHLEIMINQFDDKTSFVHCNSDLIDKDDTVFGIGVEDVVQIKLTKKIKYFLTNGNMIHSTGAIIKKEYFDLVGGWDEQFRNYGEWLLWIKLASIGNVKYCTEVKAKYRKHETNISNTFTDKKVKIELDNYFNLCKQTALDLFKLSIFTRMKIVIVVYKNSLYRYIKSFINK